MLSPLVWETALADGTVVALVRSPEDAHAVVRDNRRVVVYTMAEIARMLENYRAVTEVKTTFPGATVEVIRRQVSDPLNLIRDGESLDEPFDDIPDFA